MSASLHSGAPPAFLPQGTGSVAQDFAASPDANILDASHEQLRVLRTQLDQSLLLFVYFFFRYPELTPHWHGPICEFIGRWGDPGFTRLSITIPRDAGKTTIATRANSLWQVARDPGHNPRIGIYHANEKKAKLWIRATKEIVESNLTFRVLYEDMLPPGLGLRESRDSVPRGWTWSDSELKFNRSDTGVVEPSIGAFGVGGANQGYHFTHLIKDDLIGDKEADSETEMQKAREWIDVSRFLESPENQGNDLYVYTPWSHDDCYKHVHTRWPEEYKRYHRPALIVSPDGTETSSFPEKWTTEFLQQERERDPFEFYRQRQCTPMAGRESHFDPAWTRYGTVETRSGYRLFRIRPEHYDEKLSRADEEPKAPPVSYLDACDGVLFWDPAPSEQADRNRERNARNGKVAAVLDPWGRWLILEATGTRLDPLPELHHTIQMAIRWGIKKIAVEEVNFSKIYKHFGNYLLRKEDAYKSHNIRFIPQKRPRGEKDTRISALMPDWRAGFIYFNEGETEPILQEAREFPFSATRDMLDAFASRANEPTPVQRPPTYTAQEMYDAEQSMLESGLSGRDPVTGY